jgi:tetratricopeptide (TPR) repeat protein
MAVDRTVPTDRPEGEGASDRADPAGQSLLERGRELSELSRALNEASRGRGRIVVIEAPAGLGKTSLLAAASRTATESGFTCLRARGSELERDFAYGCVRQLLEPIIARASESERKLLFDGAAALAEPLFTPTGLDSPSPNAPYAVLHGIYWLINNLAADRPLLVSIDDVHWSDASSLRFFDYLMPRVDGVPIAVLAATRPGEGDTSGLARLATGPETILLRPRPLSVEATTVLCERRLRTGVASEFAAACHEATGGNPFFLEALLREAGEQEISTNAGDAALVRRMGPAAVAQAVLLRLSGSPPSAVAVVRALAVLGDGANVAETANLAEMARAVAARAADLLISLGILRPARGLEFAHPIVRQAVYEDIGPHERRQAHARAASMLAAAGAAAERVAAQIAEAEPVGDPDRVELLRGVAASALVQGAPAAAVTWLRRALIEPPPAEARGELLLELGSAELRVGALESVEHLEASVQLLDVPPLLARAVRELALALTMSGSADRAVEALQWAFDVIGPEDRELALILAADIHAHAQQASLEGRGPAAARLERYRDLDGATPGERLVLASLAFERARASDSAEAAARYLERGLAGGRLLAEQELDVAGPFYHLVIGLLATDALDVVGACLEEALRDARIRGSIPAFALVMSYRAKLSLRRGAVEEAETDARAALDLLTEHAVLLGIPLALAFLIEAIVERGEMDEAERFLASGVFGPEIPPGLTVNYLLEARGIHNLVCGRTKEGLTDLIEFDRRDELWGGANPDASRWRSRASLILASSGDRELAHQLSIDDLERARAGERQAGSALLCTPWLLLRVTRPRWTDSARR